MDDAEGHKIQRENTYLKLRCAQLQGDVTDLNGQVGRLQQELERIRGIRDGRGADLLSGPSA